MGLKAAKYALFDMDGLLLDTESIYTQVTQEIVQAFGKTFDWSIKGNMIGRPALDSANYLVKALDLPITGEDYLAQRNARLKQLFANCEPLAGAVELIEYLHQQGVPMAIATSSNKEMFAIKTSRHEWFEKFTCITTGCDSEVKQGKPAPDIFLLAAQRLGATDMSQCIVFEDAPSGLAAGKAAGMQVVVVPDPNMDKARYKDADLILPSLNDFPKEIFNSSHDTPS